MKAMIIAAALAAACICSTNTKAQVHVNVNIGVQPPWGPSGYDYVEYYYLPDIDAYYYVPKRQYIYLNGPNWVFVNSLPPRFRGYDVYRSYKVVVNEPRPYLRHDVYREKYKGYKGNYGKQVILRDRPDYKEHRSNSGGSKGKAQGKGKGKGHGKGHH